MSSKSNSPFDDELLEHIKSSRNDEAKSMLNEELAREYDDLGTLLHRAALYDNSVIAKHLIELGSDINFPRHDDETPLMVAIQCSHVGIVEVLLEAGANIDLVNDEGLNALQLIFENGYVEKGKKDILRLFHKKLRAEAGTIENLVAKMTIFGCNLYHAAHFNDFDIMEFMLNSGVDIDSRGYHEFTALHAAITRNNLKLAEWLTAKGANVNAQDKDGFSALLLAVVEPARTNLVKLLLIHGADPNIGTYGSGETPLFTLANLDEDHDDVIECMELLLQYGAVPREVTYLPGTIFDYALVSIDPKRAELLVAQLALYEKMGKAIDKSVMRCDFQENQEEFDKLVKYYEKCEEALGTAVHQKSSLLDLLVDGDFKMVTYARNESFTAKIEEICTELQLKKLYPYYYNTLMNRVSKAADIVRMENAAFPVINSLFNGRGSEYYIPVKIVLDYLNKCDLEQVIKV